MGNLCAICLSARLGYYLFPLCYRVPRHFSRIYRNYKWRDYTSRCSIRDKDGGDDSGPLHLPQAGLSDNGGDSIAVALLLINNKPRATAQNAIVLA